MFRTNSLHKINRTLCSYVQTKNRNNKGDLICAFMKSQELHRFYDDMLADFEIELNQKFEQKKKNCTVEQRKFKKIREDAEKIIEWDHIPQHKMNTKVKQDLKWKNCQRKRSKTSSQISSQNSRSYNMIKDIKLIKQQEEEKFIRKFRRNKMTDHNSQEQFEKKLKKSQKCIKFNIHIKNREIWREMLREVSSKPKTIETELDDRTKNRKVMEQIQNHFIRKNRYPISNL